MCVCVYVCVDLIRVNEIFFRVYTFPVQLTINQELVRTRGIQLFN